MTLTSWLRTAAVLIVGLGVLGCASSAPQPLAAATSGSGSNENQFCSWTFDRGPSGKVIADSVRVKNKTATATCSVVQSGNKLFIGDAPNNTQQILDIGSVEFVTTCRYCYTNAFGGITCIQYQGC